MPSVLFNCPACGEYPPAHSVVCPSCGQELISAEDDPMLGQVVGTYRVVKRIGLGGMGTVYEATETNIERGVALKIVHPSLSANPNLPTLLSEARTVTAIGDEGIVDVYAFGTLPDGRSYLVMELLKGESLAAILDRRKTLPVSEVLELAIPLLRALEAAHSAGFVHRDIKPANIFIVKRENRPQVPKLLDLGLAMHIKKGSELAMGTADYVSPEQADNRNVGPKADLYSLGCVLFEVLTGHLPFLAADPPAVVKLQQTAPRPSARGERPEVPAALDALITSMMAIDPTQRPASAGMVREALLKLQRGLAPRRRAAWPAVAAVAVLALVVAGALVALTRPAPRLPERPGPSTDPVALAIAHLAEDIGARLDGGALAGPAGESPLEKLIAAEAAFPGRAEWVALRGQVIAELRLEATRALQTDDAAAASARLQGLTRLGAAEADGALMRELGRLTTAQHQGMVRVGAVFIDRYEYPNQEGAAPATRVDFEEAVSLCERVGKHLCSEGEWEAACAGPAQLRYGWGNQPEPGRCLSQARHAKGPAAAGSFKRCVNASGVFDLLGNVAEWTSTPLREGAPQRVVRGGSYSQSDAKLSCVARDYLLPGQGGSAHLGFRCCL